MFLLLLCLGIVAAAIWLISLDPNEIPPAVNPEDEFDPRSPASFLGLGVMLLFTLKLLVDLLRDKKRLEFNANGVFVHYAKRPFLVPWSNITGCQILNEDNTELFIVLMHQTQPYLRNFSYFQQLTTKHYFEALNSCVVIATAPLKSSAQQIEEAFNLHFKQQAASTHPQAAASENAVLLADHS